MKSILVQSAILVTCAALTSGCAETRVEREFGDSVREVMSKQVYDPGAAAMNADPVTGGDAANLEGVLESYRGGVTDVSSVERPMSVDVGTSQ